MGELSVVRSAHDLVVLFDAISEHIPVLSHFHVIAALFWQVWVVKSHFVTAEKSALEARLILLKVRLKLPGTGFIEITLLAIF